jgi:flavodoxin
MTACEGVKLDSEREKKILVAYFSHSGNTREIAVQIHNIVGGDIFEIKAVNIYPSDYDAVVKVARRELDSGHIPVLRTKLENIPSYGLVFLGYPNWWGTIPAPVRALLSEYDFSGKAIAPFCTHEGSRLGRSVDDISKLCPKSFVREGVAIRGRVALTAQNALSGWLRKVLATADGTG